MNRIIRMGERPFQFTALAAIQFVVVTIIAMPLYAGGTHNDPGASGYSFFRNFFSSLGLIEAPNGEPNTISAMLFFVALSVAGLGLVVYFIAEPQFFQSTMVQKVLSIIGSLIGIFTGICFIGVAFTPADVYPDAHAWFVINAFRSFLFVVIFYAAAIFLNRDYQNRYAWVNLLFTILLAAYIWLLFTGPRPDSPEGELIQATGQKLIVYASILCMLVQSYGSIRLARKRSPLRA